MKTSTLLTSSLLLFTSFLSSAGARKVTVSANTRNIDEFRKIAAYAKEIGANHVMANQVEPAMWMWDFDRSDPYPNWGLRNPTVFKFIVPEKLKKYFPADYAKRNLDTLKQRAAVLREYGLKASFAGMEPAYFPEQAYLDHPEWRGARCDQARRARTEYYSPCFDNEEIRALYSESVTELCRICPFDAFCLLSNDSGGGICWCEGLYAGKNGPAFCRDIPMGERISRYLSVFQDAARAAGLTDVEANVNHIDETDEAKALPFLKPGQSVNNRTLTSKARERFIGTWKDWGDQTFPVRLLPRHISYAKQMQVAQAHPDDNLNICFRSADDAEAMAFVKRYLDKVGPGAKGRAEALAAFAEELAGADDALDLAEIWEDIERAVTYFEEYEMGGHIFMLGTVHQRWLTRPFVPFPSELKTEEKDYYRAYIFQAQEESDADNLVDLQAHRWLEGYGARVLISRAVQFSTRALADARSRAQRIAARGGKYARQAKVLDARLATYVCVIRNAGNAVTFQEFMDRADRVNPPKDRTPSAWEQGDAALVEINQLVRDEIDNTVQLIRLLESTDARLLYVAEKPEWTCVMNFEPDIVSSLKKKVAIMEAHRRDFLRLYKSLNR